MPLARTYTAAGTAERLTGIVLLAIVAIGGCGTKENVQPECEDDGACGAGVCMMGTCLPRGADRTVAIDITPRVDSFSMRTGIAEVTLSKDKVISADRRVLVDGTVAAAPDARVVLTTKSPISGLGDVQLETTLADTKFQLGIGAMLLGSRATMWLTPGDKASVQPPVPFATMLNETVGLVFPAAAEMTSIRATLQDSLGAPQSGYLVRAYALDRVVSNIATTTATGEFQLFIAPGAVPAVSMTNKTVTVEFTPSSETADAPRFVSVPFDPSNDASALRPTLFHLPAFGTPAPLRFRVQGMTPAKPQDLMPVADVSIRFSTQLLENKNEGTGIFEREVRTVGTGEAEVSLIPGTAAQARKYQVAIVPPPGSPYASHCEPEYPITIVGNTGGGQAPYSTTFNLDPKVPLSGTILGGDGKPASNVNVRATFIQGGTVCKNVTSSASVSSTTDLMGQYVMLLDPGMYRLDVEPPDGAPWPRQTEDGDKAIAVGMTGTTHDIKLPAGEVVTGHVLGGDGADLEGATIKIYEVPCKADTCASPVAPALRAQTRTGTKGEFRAVLPPLPALPQ